LLVSAAVVDWEPKLTVALNAVSEPSNEGHLLISATHAVTEWQKIIALSAESWQPVQVQLPFFALTAAWRNAPIIALNAKSSYNVSLSE